MLDSKNPPRNSNENDGLKTVFDARRSLLKLSVLGGIAALANPKNTLAKGGVDTTGATLPPAIIYPPSPPVIAWAESIPEYIYKAKLPVGELNPPPQEVGNVAMGECGRNPIQRWSDFYQEGVDSHDLYELHVNEQLHTFNPAYPAQTIWGYDGMYPGPTFKARYGRTVITRLFNELPSNHVGFGSPEISMHLHNLHTPSESDGFPSDYWSTTKFGPTLTSNGYYKDHCYPNVYAGYDQSRLGNPTAIGDPREALGTLWYHDHTLDSTAANCTKGLAGFYLLYDDVDSGNENDFSNPNAIRLPSGDFDVPLMFQDMRFDASGMQFYDQLAPEGVLGDQVVVNGKIKPFFKVARRKYRLRLLNAGPTRFYEFYLVHKGVVKPFIHISNDGNLFERPLMNQTKLALGMAERGDIIIDFSAFPIGSEVFLVNRVQQDDTRKIKAIKSPGDQVLKFIVDRNLTEHDNSRVLTATTFMRALPPIDLTEVAARRTFVFERKNGVWVVNGKIFNINSIEANPKRGTAEVWTLVNGGGGWAHPVHIHFEEGRILTRNGLPPAPHESGRKDVYVLPPDGRVEVFLRFRDFKGKYVMHCHNLPHEDHAMMVRWDIVE
jgi:FtsP/CotA-like multicopper oxidase with cupredoxin domain